MRPLLFLVVVLLLSQQLLAVESFAPVTEEKVVEVDNIRIQHIDQGGCSWDGADDWRCSDYVLVTNTNTKKQTIRANQVSKLFRDAVTAVSVQATLNVSFIEKPYRNASCEVVEDARVSTLWEEYYVLEAAARQSQASYDRCYSLVSIPENFGATPTEVLACEAVLNTTLVLAPAFPTITTNYSSCPLLVDRPVFTRFAPFTGSDSLSIEGGEYMGVQLSWRGTPRSTNFWSLTVGGVELDPEVDACFNTSASGTYTLNQSIGQTTQNIDCVRILHNNTKLDCQGLYTIGAPFGSFASGVHVINSSNFTMVNCNITTALGLSDYGIHLENSVNITVINASINPVGLSGILIENSDNSIWTNVDMLTPGGGGAGDQITIDGGDNHTFKNLATVVFRTIGGTNENINVTNFTGRSISNEGGVNSDFFFTNGSLTGGFVVSVYGSNIKGTYTNITYTNHWRALNPSGGDYTNITITNFSEYGVYCFFESGATISNLVISSEDMGVHNIYYGQNCNTLNITGISFDDRLNDINESIKMAGGFASHSNIVDCAEQESFSRQGTGAGTGVKFFVPDTLSYNNTLQNCNVTAFAYGVYILEAGQGASYFRNNHFHNSSYAFWVEGRDDLFINNTLTTGFLVAAFHFFPFGVLPVVYPDNTQIYNTDIRYEWNDAVGAGVKAFDLSRGTNYTIYNVTTTTLEIVADTGTGVTGTFDCAGGWSKRGNINPRFTIGAANFIVSNCNIRDGGEGIRLEVTGSEYHDVNYYNMTAPIQTAAANVIISNVTIQNESGGMATKRQSNGGHFTNIFINASSAASCMTFQTGGAARLPRPKNNVFRNITCHTPQTQIFSFGNDKTDGNEFHDMKLYCGGASGFSITDGDNSIVNNSFFYNCSTALLLAGTATGGNNLGNTFREGSIGINVSAAASSNNNFTNNYACENSIVDFSDADTNNWTGNQCNSTSGGASCSSVPYACPVVEEELSPIMAYCYSKDIRACRLLWYLYIALQT